LVRGAVEEGLTLEDRPGHDQTKDQLTMGIKRRVIAGAAVGTTVFGAVFGLAAGLDVTSGDKIGSGQATVTSCDLDGVTTSYVFDGASGSVTAIRVDGIADSCDDAVATVAGSHTYTDSSSNSYSDGPAATGSASVRTYVNDENVANNSVTVTLDTPIAAELFTMVTVTLHGGHEPFAFAP
jgi:hypothetical protein